jgi:membrane-anchored protein YejM (alkaline phosphatase superfamily)
MNRRNFSLSWGRKLFFGISWPLSSLLSLLYLRSFILPETSSDWLYFITTFFGQIGILNAILYFVFYGPIALLLPSYYVSRFWSLILILALNLFILIDALSFSNYHLHIYSYISKLLVEEGFYHLLGSSAGFLLLTAGLFFLAILIWIRGEVVWRYMQGRFSNPVKNWYLVLIVFSFIMSKSIYRYSDIHPNLASLFPLNLNLPRPEKEFHDNRRFFYPADSLACQGKQNPNVILMVIKEWGADQFNPDSMPKTFHMQRHATTFTSHRGVSSDADAGIFSLLYSIPSSYQSAIDDARPAFMKEIETRKYEIVRFNPEKAEGDPVSKDESTLLQFRQWAENRSSDKASPFFLSLIFESHYSLVDKNIQDIILLLQKEDILKDTHIILTGGFTKTSENIPLMWMESERKPSIVSNITTHYDVIPSIAQKLWGCKKAFKSASVGSSLNEGKDWFLKTTYAGYEIIDLKTNGVLKVEDGQITTTATARRELIFPALRLMTKFNRPN